MSKNVVTFTEKNFSTVALGTQNKPVLIDYWAPWCAPCRAIAPVIEQLAEHYAGRAIIGKVNVDDESELAAAANIQAIPTMLIIYNGKVQEVIQGMRPMHDLQARLDAVMQAHQTAASSGVTAVS